MNRYLNYILLAATLLLFALPASADTDRAISIDRLPEKARAFIDENFPCAKVAYVTQERDFLQLTYEVMFTHGLDIVFDSRGNWTDIECRYGEIPFILVPEPMRKDIENRFSEKSVRKVSKLKTGYEIKLRGGIDLVYDKSFKLIDIDD